MFIALPLLAIPVVLYNLIAAAKMAGRASTGTNAALTAPLFSVPTTEPPLNWQSSEG